MGRTAILAATVSAGKVAERLARELLDAEIVDNRQGVRQTLERAWNHYDSIICVMAAGIVVRCVAGLCRNKYHDPCIVVVDEQGHHAISLLSGHIGGGNVLAEKVAEICGGTPVLTTASDVSGHTAIDLWSVEENLAIANPAKLASTAAKLLAHGVLKVFQEAWFIKTLPEDFQPCTNRRDADIVIALIPGEESGLLLIPRIRFIGLGCRRGTPVEEFDRVIADLAAQDGLDLRSVGGLASIDIKNDEPGLLDLGDRRNWPIRFFSREQISSVEGTAKSDIVHQKIGVFGVCESAAVLAASTREHSGRLIIKKKKWERITAAVAETEY